MECFISNNDDRILLVGEGNFSFSVDFVKYAEKNFTNFFTHHEKYSIISTCFQPESEISAIASLNVNFLREKGIQVEFGIDATCLEQYAFLGDDTHSQQFSRIIFNFPHVGGKMRIERNRKLLRDFLVSAGQLVRQPDSGSGSISVALCAGQGGSTVEKGARRWDDTWKAVEAAGEAGMLLTAVWPFPSASVLQEYCSTGYRGLQKGFCLTDARVHVFQPNRIPLPKPLSPAEMDGLLSTSQSLNTAYHRAQIVKNPWERCTGEQSKFIDRFVSHTNDPQCRLLDGIAVCGAFDDGPSASVALGTVQRCLLLNELSDDFSLAPVECVAHLNCVDAGDVARQTLARMFAGDCDNFDRFLVVGEDGCGVRILVDRLLDGDWRRLWTNGVACVSPHSYTLDITFSVSSALCVRKLVNVLWVIGGDFIVKIEQLSRFVFDGGEKINYCYRIVYRSYDLPLYRARIIQIHKEVIAGALEYHLNAKVV